MQPSVESYVAILDGSTPPAQAYGATAPAPPMPDVKQQDVPHIVQSLRASFATGATKNIATRKALLKQLQKLMDEGVPLLEDALWKDLHKHPIESFATELALIKAEIQDFLDDLSSWSKPKLAATALCNLPGLAYIVPEPLGVVCIIDTWNYPVQLALMPLIAALGAGNCVLLRLPDQDTVKHTIVALMTLLDKYVDQRYVRYVYGGLDESKAVLAQKYDLIFATGSHVLGKVVARAAAETLTPIVLELGGKSPAIVDPSADLELSARRLAWAAFTNAGQTCVRPDYLMVHSSIGDRFVDLLYKYTLQFYGVDSQSSDSLGRIVNKRMFDRLTRLIETDRQYVSHGGATDVRDLFIQPTVFNFKSDLAAFERSAVMQDENFGPLLPIYYYDGDETQPIEFISNRPKPLALYHFSTNSRNKARVVKQTSAGSMMVNDCLMQLANPSVPFGGVGNSGMGAYHGKFGFDAFSHRKSVIYKYSLLDLPARYAPYSPMARRILGVVLYPFSKLQIRLTVGTLVLLLALVIALSVAA